MNLRIRLKPTLGVILFGSLAACNTSGPPMPSGYVADLWSDQVRQFSIFPVFPPRADLQVGDIYMSCEESPPPDQRAAAGTVAVSTGRDHATMWLTSVPGMLTLKDANGKPGTPGMLSAQYLTRVQMPVNPSASAPVATSAPENPASSAEAASAVKEADAAKGAKGAKGANAAKGTKIEKVAKGAAKPASGAAGAGTPPSKPAVDIFAGSAPVRLMTVSLPEFFSISATSAQAQALIPFPSVLAKAGLSYEKAQNIQISVPSAESYGVPAGDLYAVLEDTKNKKMVNALRWANKTFDANKDGFCKYGTPDMEVVTEVYAARAITVSITYSKSTGAEAAVGLSYASGTKQATVLGALSKYLSPAPASGASAASAAAVLLPAPTGASEPTIEQATAFIQQLNELYKQLGEGNQSLQYPGVEVSIINGNGSGVIMNRQFDSPVVIGYRGFKVLPN
jgi:hypothetical protein